MEGTKGSFIFITPLSGASELGWGYIGNKWNRDLPFFVSIPWNNIGNWQGHRVVNLQSNTLLAIEKINLGLVKRENNSTVKAFCFALVVAASNIIISDNIDNEASQN